MLFQAPVSIAGPIKPWMEAIDRPEAAEMVLIGAAVIGPGVFNTWVAPRATGQDCAVGEVVSDIGWGS